MAGSLVRTEAFRYQDAEIVCQCATLATEMRKKALTDQLQGIIKGGDEFLLGYIDVATQTQRAEGLGFELPDSTAEIKAHIASFEAYIELPLDLIGKWMNVLIRLNTPLGEKPYLQPGATVNDPKVAAPEKNIVGA